MDINVQFEAPEADKARTRASDRIIEATNLNDLSLQQELLQQYNRARRMMVDAEAEEGSTINQKASGLNAVTAILQAIIKMQTELYSAERVKIIETTLIDVLQQDFPEVKDRFIELYTRRLEAMSD